MVSPTREKLQLTSSFSKEDDVEEQKGERHVVFSVDGDVCGPGWDLAKVDESHDPLFSYLDGWNDESQKEDPDETLPLEKKKSASPVRQYLVPTALSEDFVLFYKLPKN